MLLCVNSRGIEKRRVLVSGFRVASSCFFGVSSEVLFVFYYFDLGIFWLEWLV